MIKIFFNTLKILLRKKDFLLIGIILPSLITVLLSFLMGQPFKYNIGIIDNDKSNLSIALENRLVEIEGINLVRLNGNEEELILLREISLCIKIKEDFNENIAKGIDNENIEIIYGNSSEILEVVKLIVKEEEKIYKNISRLAKGDEKEFNSILREGKELANGKILETKRGNLVKVKSSLGVIIMFIFLSSSIITRYIIVENKKGTRGRILASAISQWKYNLSILLVFYFASSLTTVFYYLLCKGLKFDFGIENSLYYLIILLFVNLMAVTFNLFIGNLVSKPEGAINLNIIIIVPLAMISGCFWNFNFMGENIKSIGNIVPLRWAIYAVEKLERGEKIESILPIFGLFFLVSIILFGGSKLLGERNFKN